MKNLNQDSSSEVAEMNVLPPHVQLIGFIGGHVISKCIKVAADLGIADYLKEQPKDVKLLAKESNSYAPALLRVLRTLSSVGIFQEKEQEVFAQSDISFFLRSDVEGSQRNFARMFIGEWFWKVLNDMPHTVKTGEAALPKALEVDSMWDYLSKIDPEAGELFNLSMTSFSSSFNEPIANAYDFSVFQSIIDIGGSHGSMVKAIVNKYPGLKGYVLDLPEVVESAKKMANPENIEFIGGDFFKPITVRTDCQILRFIIHDWGDEDAIRILKNCRQSINDNGRILIAEHLIKPDNMPGFEKILDITMMVNYGTAKERTVEEFGALYEAAGFKLTKVIPTGTPFFLFEGTPV